MTVLLALLACGSIPSAPPSPKSTTESPEPPPSEAEYWVERTDVELDEVLSSACSTAVAGAKPVLLAFSAPWCGDCRKVRALETTPPLRDELQKWTKVVVNVGRFDRHPGLLEAFGVRSIAHWVALDPDCSQPVTDWRRLDAGTFEPASNPEGATATDLAAWLLAARTP